MPKPVVRKGFVVLGQRTGLSTWASTSWVCVGGGGAGGGGRGGNRGKTHGEILIPDVPALSRACASNKRRGREPAGRLCHELDPSLAE